MSGPAASRGGGTRLAHEEPHREARELAGGEVLDRLVLEPAPLQVGDLWGVAVLPAAAGRFGETSALSRNELYGLESNRTTMEVGRCREEEG